MLAWAMNQIRTSMVLLLTVFPAACGDDDGGGSRADAAHGQSDATAADAAAPDAGPTSIAVHTLTGRTLGNVALVAAQDGDAAWQVLEGTDGEYSFVSNGRFGVIVACAQEDGAVLYATYATTGDFSEVWGNCEGEPDPTGSVEVTMTGLDSNDQVTATFVFGSRGMTQTVPTTTFTDIPIGTQDMFLSVRNGTNPANRFFVVRDIAVTEGGTTQFTIDEGDALSAEPITVDFSGATGGDESYSYSVGLLTEHGTQGQLRSGAGSDGQLELAALPVAVLDDAELHTASYSARNDDNSVQRKASSYFHAPADQSLILPPPLDMAVSVGEETPYLRPRLSVTAQEPVQLYTGNILQNTTPGRQITFVFTDDWLAGSDIDWTMPDLSELEGWDADWALIDATEISYAGFAYSSSVPSALDYFRGSPYDLPATRPEWDGRQDTRSVTIGRFTP